MKHLYLLLAILGAAIPYSQFVPWLLLHGLDLPLFFEQLFANRISAFFALDLILSAIVLILYISHRGAQTRTPHLWVPIVATCLVGISCGLPLFLWLQEHHAATNAPDLSTQQ